jgi:hypothetical protein
MIASIGIQNWGDRGAVSAEQDFLILLTEAVMMAMLFVFVILGGRNHLTFLPRCIDKDRVKDVSNLDSTQYRPSA